MKSRWIVNLLLLLGIVGLVLIAKFEPGIKGPPTTRPITTMKTDDVHRIHLNRPLHDDLVLVRQSPGHWLIQRAAPLPADDFKVRALARLAEQKPVRSYKAADMDLASLQLSPPYATVFLNDNAIEFGSLEPIDGLRYVRAGDRVYLVPDKYMPLVEAGYTQFVSPRLFDKDAHIESITLPDFSLSREGGHWKLDPERAGVSEAVLQQFADVWLNATALAVQNANPDQSGDPVKIRLQGKTDPVVFQAVSRKPELVLVRPDYGIEYRFGNRSEALLTLDAAKVDVKD